MLEDIRAKLHEHGRFCSFERRFNAFANITAATGRLLIAETHRPGGGGTGRSFWLHSGSGVTILGLWSGIEYHITDESRTWDIVSGVLDGRLCGAPESAKVAYDAESHSGDDNVWPGHETPRSLRSTTGCAIRPFGFLQVFPLGFGERLPEATHSHVQTTLTRNEFVRRIVPTVDECNLSNDGFVHIRLRTASALTRFHAGGTMYVNNLPIMMYESVRDTDDEVSLLRSLVGIGCTVYDAWKNRVHLDDPYYAFPSSGPRPEEPANAWED